MLIVTYGQKVVETDKKRKLAFKKWIFGTFGQKFIFFSGLLLTEWACKCASISFHPILIVEFLPPSHQITGVKILKFAQKIDTAKKSTGNTRFRTTTLLSRTKRLVGYYLLKVMTFIYFHTYQVFSLYSSKNGKTS